MSFEQSRQERSEHEAGHFFLLFFQKVPHIPGYITIKCYKEDSEGSNFHQWPPRWAQGAQFSEQLGLFYLAGMVAQTQGLILRGNRITPPMKRRLEEGAAGDIRLFTDLNVGDREKYEDHVRSVVNNNWSMIGTLSMELQERETLFHEEPALILALEKAEDPILKELLNEFLARYRDKREESVSGAASESFRSRYPNTTFLESVADLASRKPHIFSDLQEALSKFSLHKIPFLSDIILGRGFSKARVLRDSVVGRVMSAFRRQDS